MNAAECHYRLKMLAQTQQRLTLELGEILASLGYGRTQDHINLAQAGRHMSLALENLDKIRIDLETILHIALAQEVEDKHARAEEAK